MPGRLPGIRPPSRVGAGALPGGFAARCYPVLAVVNAGRFRYHPGMGRVRVCRQVVSLCVALACAGSAAARPDRRPALLVAQPQVSVANHTNADLIYASIVAGLHDALLREVPAAERQFVQVFTERAINDEQRSKIAPIALFAQFSSDDLDRALTSRFKEAQGFRLARFLEVTIAELSPGNYDVTLTLYEPGTPWRTISEKRIGGCNEPIDDLTATAREIAARLIEPQGKVVLPGPKIAIQPPADHNVYLVGSRITLDSCGIDNPAGDQFTVTWSLPGAVHRRRVSLVLDHPQTLTLTQTVSRGSIAADPATVTIMVVAPPRADPVVETCAATGACKEAMNANYDVGASGLNTANANAPAESPAPPGNPPEALNAPASPLRGDDGVPVTGRRASEARDLRIIRLAAGVNHVRLHARGIEPNQSVQWTQLAGPELPGLDLRRDIVGFDLEATASGYYVFKLAVTAGNQTEEARISFLAAPAIHADAGRAAEAKVGEPILLDGSGSYDVLGDQISFTWVLTEKNQQNDARIIDSHDAHPRFVADEPGIYKIRMYARVLRKIDDSALVEIATDGTSVKVTRSDFQLFADTFSSPTTPEIFRVGAVYEPAIARFSTTARTFSYHRFAGLAVGSDKNENLTGELMLGLGLRLQSRFLLDLFGRVYSRQNKDLSHQVGFGVGANFSLSVVGGLWLQIKVHLGPPTVFSEEASQLFAWEPGLGLAYEL